MQLIHNFDILMTRWVQLLPFGLAWLMPIATFIGLPGLMTAYGAMFAVVAFARGSQQIALAFVTASVSLLAPTLIKLVVRRVRPDTLYAAGIHSSSFPSGHAFDAVVILGLLGFVLYHSTHSLIYPVILGFIALIIGISRVYLGAHFPTDVLAGWLLGGLTLTAIIRGFRL